MKQKSHYATIRLSGEEYQRFTELGEAMSQRGIDLGVSALLRLFITQSINRYEWKDIISNPAMLLEGKR